MDTALLIFLAIGVAIVLGALGLLLATFTDRRPPRD